MENKEKNNEKLNKKSSKKDEQKNQQKSKGDKKNKVDYKKMWNDALKEIEQLSNKIMEMENTYESSVNSFKEKAKSFASKAQEEINKHKENIDKFLEKEKELLKKYSSQKLFESIINPILNIDIAIEAGKNDEKVKDYVIGFEMLLNQLYEEMKEFGLTKIEPKIGDMFDPNIHHAISTIDGKEKNKIIEVKKIGFKLYDRVIMPATVTIGK